MLLSNSSKKPKNAAKQKLYKKKPPALPWRLLLSKAKLTLLSRPQDSAVIMRKLILITSLFNVHIPLLNLDGDTH